MKERTVKINILFVFLTLFLFGAICFKLTVVALSEEVDGINIKEFASGRNTAKEVLRAERGVIYDSKGEILAKNVNSYTVIAYLEKSRTTDSTNPEHVVDKEATAKALSPIINMSEEKIIELLNVDAYQVELGPGGRGITELVKEQIDDLDLSGIDFISSTKRYYPNGDFLSYILGYAKSNEKGNIVGELGLELYYNDILTGKNGYRKYQQDIYGYQIANTPSRTKKAVSGSNIYLTIDTNIQMFTEQAMSTLEEGKLEWGTIGVMDAKTGAILSIASNPSFNPNTKDITSYYDPFISYNYEPGSVMKIFSFMAAIENGVYNGSEKYKSGNTKVDDSLISDWNKYGWGEITYDEGFYASSNVAATLLSQKLGREKLMDFYTSLGFGEQTKITLPNELFGSVDFKYQTEIATASFGQGISATGIQMLQALSSIANDGTVIKPYIVKKIVDSTKKVTYEGKREEVKKVASAETIEKIKDLMSGVIDGRSSIATGLQYNVPGFNLIGKTGTAQIASDSGGYLTGYNDYIRTLSIIYPKEDPKIIIYLSASKLAYSNVMTKAVKELVTDIGTYLNIENKNINSEEETIILDSFVNKDTKEVETNLKSIGIEPIIIGNGNKIIKQFPSKKTIVTKKDKIFLLTNADTYYFPKMIGYSRTDATNFGSLLGLKFKFDGYGYVKTLSVSPGSVIDASKIIEISLAPKYEIEKDEKN